MAGGTPWAEDPGRFINRELSWLDFAARLLDLVADDRLPLLERVKFLGIFAEGLDEFFQVRVAGLEDQVAAGLRTRSPDGMSPREQLAAITERATGLVARHSRCFLDQVGPALTAAGVVLSDWHTLDDGDRAHLGEVFERGRSSRSSPPWPWARGIRSPTSPTSRSTWWSWWPTPSPERSAWPG